MENTLPKGPLPTEEREWIYTRTAELSAKEKLQYKAALQECDPEESVGLVNLLLSLDRYEICYPACNNKQLGEYVLRYIHPCREDLLPYIDAEKLGEAFRKDHYGRFVDNAYVMIPESLLPVRYDEPSYERMRDAGWSVKLKLASKCVPEGVWLRLPDYEDINDGKPDEIRIALDALGVPTVQECTLLEARCILPEAGNLMEQYKDIADLIYDGQNLGFVLDEQGQGSRDFMARFAAALEYENCHRLDLALDISQNLECYSFVPVAEIKDFTVRCLHDRGMPDELLASDCVNLDASAEDMLERQGYILTKDESAYIGRNARPFVYEFSAEPLTGMVLE